MPVTQNDLVTWTSNGYLTAPAAQVIAAINTRLRADGWRVLRITQPTGNSLIIQAYAPRSFPTSTEIITYFRSAAAGWVSNASHIASAGADWLTAHPEQKPGFLTQIAASLGVSESTAMYGGFAVALLLVALVGRRAR